ncbi:MAG: hypothetical protein HY842_20120 [Bacteroidetes bacterium]|nr:hypothetical protein [Bacteroidota bacterium]
MPTCPDNTNYPLYDGSLNQIRTIRFTADRQTIEVVLIATNTVECTRSINSGSFIGMRIQNNNFAFTSAFLNLQNSLDTAVDGNPAVSIGPDNGVLQIIGSDDHTMGFQAPNVNIRYDAARDEVKFEY